MYKGRDLGKKKNLNISRHLRAMPIKSGAIFIAGAIFFADTVALTVQQQQCNSSSATAVVGSSSLKPAI